MSDGSVIYEARVDGSKIDGDLSNANAKVKSGADKFSSIMKTAAIAVGIALAKAAVEVVEVGMEFEAQMSRVQAISGATAEELEKLEEQAIELGAATIFSASEVAEAMENLASAGFTTIEIMSALPGVLDLAAISGGNVAAAAEVAATVLRAFNLDASESGHVADVLARAAADTNAEVADMGEAMKYVAPVAKAMEISMEETAAAIGIMSDAGIKGSQAGTSLRGALSRLAKPTKPMRELMEELGISFYDTAGNMLSLEEQITVLQGAFAGLTQQERNHALVTLYGQESLSGMLSLIEAGPEKVNELTNSFVNSDGAAAEMAAIINDNLKGSLEGMSGTLESIGLMLYDQMQVPLKEAVSGLDDLFSKMMETGAVDNLGKLLAMLSEVVGESLVTVLNVLFEAISAILPPLLDILDVILPPLLAILEPFNELIEMAAGLFGDVFTQLGPLTKMLSGGLATALAIVADSLTIVVGILGLLIEGIKWLLGKDTDFSKYTTMIESPFTGNGATSQTLNKQAQSYMTHGGGVKGFKTGLDYVPADDFPALLHRGEMVLTAGEAAAYRAEQSASTPGATQNSSSMSIGSLTINPNAEQWAQVMDLLQQAGSATQHERAGYRDGTI